MRVLVTGGRRYNRPDIVDRVLGGLKKTYGPLVVVHGAAPGLDSLARNLAVANGCEEDPLPDHGCGCGDGGRGCRQHPKRATVTGG